MKLNLINKYIPVNKSFWSKYKPKYSDAHILIEEPKVPYITHLNAVFSLILNQAKSYIPVWCYSNKVDLQFLQSYMPLAEYRKLPKLNIKQYIRTFIKAINSFIKIYQSKNILSFEYEGIKYGDIAYDTYLMERKVATICRFDHYLLLIFLAIIIRHETVKKILGSANFVAVLVSHQIDIESGVMLRVAINLGYKGYLRAGHHQSTLQCFTKLDEVYDYEYKPFPNDINKIITLFGNKLEKKFNTVLQRQTSGKGDADGKYAYNPQNKFYHSKKTFCENFSLDPHRKNIFIMLHALNDYPHSHFRWMIFKDYYNWMMETLKFAKEFKNANWIFKQHPSIRFYPTRDISFQKIFHSLPKHVVYIDENKQIDTRSLVFCADIVVTCLGSAGFELPAMAAIPTIVASDNFYTNLGFAYEPKNRSEYFDLLKKVHTIERLTLDQQEKAKAAYIFIYEFSRVDISCCPILSLEDQNSSEIFRNYWKFVMDLYTSEKHKIFKETNKYIKDVSKFNFERLLSIN